MRVIIVFLLMLPILMGCKSEAIDSDVGGLLKPGPLGKTVFTCPVNFETHNVVIIDEANNRHQDTWVIVVIKNPKGPITLCRAVWATKRKVPPIKLEEGATYTFSTKMASIFHNGANTEHPFISKVEKDGKVLLDNWNPFKRYYEKNP